MLERRRGGATPRPRSIRPSTTHRAFFGVSCLSGALSLVGCETTPILRPMDSGAPERASSSAEAQDAGTTSGRLASSTPAPRLADAGCDGALCMLGEMRCQAGMMLQCEMDARGCPVMLAVAACSATCEAADGECPGRDDDCDLADPQCVADSDHEIVPRCPDEPCHQEGANLGCEAGTQRRCVADHDGCFRIETLRCDRGACWDADRCASIVAIQPEVSEPIRTVAIDSGGHLHLLFTGRANELCTARVTAGGRKEWIRCVGTPGVSPRASGIAVSSANEVAIIGDVFDDMDRRGWALAALWPNSEVGTRPAWRQDEVIETPRDSDGDEVVFGADGGMFISGGFRTSTVGVGASVVARLHRDDGRLLWSRAWPDGGRISVATDGPSVYAAMTGPDGKAVYKLRGSDGEPVWSRTWNLEGNLVWVRANTSGDVVLASGFPSESHVLKLGNRGEVLWTTSAGPEGCGLSQIALAEDGSILALCDHHLIKLDADGNETFRIQLRLWAGTLSLAAGPVGGQPGFVVAGYPNPSLSPRALWVSPR